MLLQPRYIYFVFIGRTRTTTLIDSLISNIEDFIIEILNI